MADGLFRAAKEADLIIVGKGGRESIASKLFAKNGNVPVDVVWVGDRRMMYMVEDFSRRRSMFFARSKTARPTAERRRKRNGRGTKKWPALSGRSSRSGWERSSTATRSGPRLPHLASPQGGRI